MYDKDALCQKIKSIYPEVGECGMDVKVDFNENENAYVVHLEKGEHKLKTFLDQEDADTCMEGKQCVNLGVDIGQLKELINKV
ncbi:MAG: hypothetical protein ACQET7_10815 [Thermodesulfobacteriota bacterium]